MNYKNRIIWLDCLRTVACFAVVFAHTAALTFFARNPISLGWNICNCYDAMCYWSNECFFMITGIFFLDPKREISIGTLYNKYVKKIALVFLFWFPLNSIFLSWFEGNPFVSNNILGILKEICFLNPRHLWFLPTIIGAYISAPFVRCITRDKKILPYFVCVGILVYIVCNINIKTGVFLGRYLVAPCFPFVLGYYLMECKINRKTEFALYVLGIAAYLTMVLTTAYFSRTAGKTVIKYFYEAVVATSVAVFCFFKCRVSKINFSNKVASVIQFLSFHTLGIYLLHFACIRIINRYIVSVSSFSLLLSIPVVALMGFLMALAVTVLLKKIPWFNRYFV